jgi:hypothetical protein
MPKVPLTGTVKLTARVLLQGAGVVAPDGQTFTLPKLTACALAVGAFHATKVKASNTVVGAAQRREKCFMGISIRDIQVSPRWCNKILACHLTAKNMRGREAGGKQGGGLVQLATVLAPVRLGSGPGWR